MSFYLKSAIAAYNLPKVKDFVAQSSRFEGTVVPLEEATIKAKRPPIHSTVEDKLKAQEVAYREKNIHYRENNRQYRIDHKEERQAYNRQYRIDHKEERQAYNRQHRIDHKEEIHHYNRQYYQDTQFKRNGYDPNSPIDIVVRNYNNLHARHKKFFSDQECITLTYFKQLNDNADLISALSGVKTIF